MIGGSTFAMSLAVTSYSRDRRVRIRVVRHSSVRLPSPPTIAKPRKLAWCLCHVPGLVTSPSLAIQKPEQWKFAKRLCSRSGRRPGQRRRNTALTRNRRDQKFNLLAPTMLPLALRPKFFLSRVITSISLYRHVQWSTWAYDARRAKSRRFFIAIAVKMPE